MNQSKQEMLDEIEATHGMKLSLTNSWTTEEVTRDFEITGFLAPFCTAVDRETETKGTLMFIHRPRIYYSWQES